MHDFKFCFMCPDCGEETIIKSEEYYQKTMRARINCGSMFPYSDQCIKDKIEHDQELYCKCVECSKVSVFRHHDNRPHQEVTCPFCGSVLPNERCVNRKKNPKANHVLPLLLFFYDDRMKIREKADKILRAKPLEEEPDRAFVQWSDEEEIADRGRGKH